MKLSKRLQQIRAMTASNYDHIWDCCCDHGLLGMSLLETNLLDQYTPKIHFVDIVPKLMEELEKKLHKHFVNHTKSHTPNPLQNDWQTHCLDVSDLPLASYPGKHLIIIAGVGGDQTCQFIEDICKNNPDLSFDFLLCPVHQLYHVRSQLIKQNLELKSEVLLEENQRFYELILASKSPKTSNNINHTTNAVSPVGKQIWQCESKDSLTIAQNYLNKTLGHYRRILQGSENKEIAGIIEKYHKIQQDLDVQALKISGAR